MADKDTIYSIVPHSGELNEHSALKLAGYHELLCAVLEAANADTGHSLCATLERGFAWAFISLTLEVYHPVRSCTPLNSRTWLSPMRFPYCRREVCISDADGVTAALASIFMIPLDVAAHRVVFDRERLGGWTPQTSQALLPQACYRMSEPNGFGVIEQRTVRASDIDALGHMNNCRYGALAYDTLNAEERSMLEQPFRYVIDFRHQVALGDSIAIERAVDGAVYVRGLRSDPDEVSFVCSLAPMAGFEAQE